MSPAAIALLTLALIPTPRERVDTSLSRTAYLMGTRVTLSARGGARHEQVEALETLLGSVEQTDNDLSTWRDTPFSRLNASPAGRPAILERRSCELMRELSEWTRKTLGAFDPAVGPLLDLWGIQTRARVPEETEIQRVRSVSSLGAWQWNPTRCTLVRPPGGRLDSGGFGKGEAIDRVRRIAPPRLAWMTDLGGQIGVGAGASQSTWTVGIAHPLERSRVLFDVELREGSIATSGGSERDQQAAGARVGHILDPRTGRPAPFAGSVVVWHERGLVADILSTALYVMGPEEGLQWAGKNGVAACFLVPAGRAVRIRQTAQFTRVFGVVASPAARRGQLTGVRGMGRL